MLFSYKIIIPKHQVYLEYLGENQRDSILRNVVCVSRGAKSVGKDNICRKGQYVSEGAKCVGKDNICRTVWRVNVGQNLSERTICVGKGKMCRKKKIKKSLTVSLKGILWILFRHIV